MIVGVIGLGRMGQGIVRRLVHGGHTVIGYDPSIKLTQNHIQEKDIFYTGSFKNASSIEELCKETPIIWLMVPAGKTVDSVINTIVSAKQSTNIIIDGGNSFFKDSVRRYYALKDHTISFIDCGTSGGLQGKERGYCLMVGGDKPAFDLCEPLLKALAAPHGYEYIGPSGSGHYVKMVHNGIEYALLQAYAEGFAILKNGSYKNTNLEKISALWNNGSIIRSWILELARQVFTREQNFYDIKGTIGESGTGLWTVQEAEQHTISVDVIKKSLEIREESRIKGGNYATKIVSLLRNAFGGHAVH